MTVFPTAPCLTRAESVHWNRPWLSVPPAAVAAPAILAVILAGTVAAAGWGIEAAVAVAAAGLFLAGVCMPMSSVRAALLAALLLTPDIPSGQSLGLQVHWSHGLTLTNFLIPALAVPLLLGAWLAGRRLTPASWPGLARGYFVLLGWGVLTLLGPAAAGELGLEAASTLLAHLAKIAFFVWLGVVLCGDGSHLRRILLIGIAVNAGFGLGQVAGWLPTFSPLANAGSRARATGLFFDANMYAVLMAWALLWLLCEPPALASSTVWRRWGRRALALAAAANLIAAGSRAGYLALAAGCVFLLLRRQRRPVLGCLLLLGLLAAGFPMRSWQRIRAAALTVRTELQTPVIAGMVAADTSTQARFDSMRQAERQIAAHPVLGSGFGRALYLGLPAITSTPVQAPGAGFDGAQNMYLTVLAAMGPVGLMLLLLALAAPLRQPWRVSELAIPAGFIGVLAASCTLELLWNARILALLVLLTTGALATASSSSAAIPDPKVSG